MINLAQIARLFVIFAFAVPAISQRLSAQSSGVDLSQLSGMWEGSVKSPSWTDHVRLLLVTQGQKLSGWMWRSTPASRFPDELTGTVNGSAEFRIQTHGGMIYIGRFSNPMTMVGERPNGNEDDKSIPRFPFQLNRIRNAVAADFPPPMPSTSSDWNVFYARFKSAIAQHDRNALSRLMTRQFGYADDTEATPEKVFRNLDWKQVSHALSAAIKPCVYKPATNLAANCALDIHPCPKCSYSVLVSFEKGSDRQWRWASVVFPGD